MPRRFNLRLALLGAIAALFFPVAAQIPPRLKRCLPYPTLAEEISEMTSQKSEVPDATVFVDSVKLRGGNSLPDAVRQRLLTPVTPRGRFSEDWLREFEQVGARGVLQQAGYFKAVVQAEGQILSTNATSQHVAINLRVAEGPQYRLSSARFRSASEPTPLTFTVETLRGHLPLLDGAFFDVSKIRQGLESMTRLYGRLGYIDLTIEAQTEIDEESRTIAISFVLNPETQFRIGKVEVWGPDSASERLLQSKWRAGDIFNTERLDGFFKENKAILPSDASREDLQVLRNVKERTVDLKFDFRTCPQPQT